MGGAACSQVKVRVGREFIYEVQAAFNLFDIAVFCINNNRHVPKTVTHLAGAAQRAIFRDVIHSYVPQDELQYVEGWKTITKNTMDHLMKICNQEILKQLNQEGETKINLPSVAFSIWPILTNSSASIVAHVHKNGVYYNYRNDFNEIDVAIACKKFLYPTAEQFDLLKTALPIVQGNYLLSVKRILDVGSRICNKDWTIEFHNLVKRFDADNLHNNVLLYTKLFAADFSLDFLFCKEVNTIILSYVPDTPPYEVIIKRLLQLS